MRIISVVILSGVLHANDAVQPGRLLVDPPTFENAGFRWIIEGDDNRNANVEVAYRRRGETRWRPAQPLLRVHGELVNQDYEPHRVGNLFAGSVLFLDPGTAYEVRLSMTDPDGGAPAPRIIPVTTRAEPKPLAPRRTHKVDAGKAGAFELAWEGAGPGDEIRFSAGTHRFPATVRLRKSGRAGAPIAIRGEPGAVIEGAGHAVDLFDIVGADYLLFEDLTVRHARTAIHAGGKGSPGTSQLTVSRCRFEDLIYGINTLSENSADWLITDNVFEGTNPTWFPRPEKTYMQPSHTGINVYGRGHVVRYNRVSRFSDSIAIANFGIPPDDPEKQAVAIDFHGNDLSWAQDDTIETDYGSHNVRVYRNRCYNAHTGISVQPFYGGPAYLIGNEVYGVTSLTFKIHNYSAGILAWHNTVASAGSGFRSFNKWQNGHFRNNLFLGGDGYAMDTGTLSGYSTLDYNGYRRNRPGDLIRWFDGNAIRTFASLDAFHDGTGHESHGLVVDYDVFERASPPRQGVTVDPSAYDLRLRANPGNAAIDRGTPLANVNDGFRGKAPDLGCYEAGTEPPRYGPRPRN